ncbi:MAG: hypothetical protein AAF456_17640 [Planctomycetota bacterium]
MASEFTDAELEAYLDEALDPVRAADLEAAAKEDSELLGRLSHINGRRDAGIHTLGEIWRRNQLGVPSVEQMSNFLLGISSLEEADYIRFRLEQLKCPFTIAMFKDLQHQQEGESNTTETRRRKYFNSSAGLLRKDNDDAED